MGVIRRQSLKRTLVSYTGVAIGVVSNLLIYPLAFEVYGLSQFILASASLIIPFASLGVSRLTVRFFPDFRDETDHHGFLGLMSLVFLSAFTLFLVLAYFFEDSLFQLFELAGMDSIRFQENRFVILIIGFLLIANSLLAQFASNFKRIVVPEIFNNLLLKLALPSLVLLFFSGYLTQYQFKWLYAASFFFVFLGLTGYVRFLGQLNFRLRLSFVNRPLLREMLIFGLFSALGTIGYLLSFRIDSIMITSFLGYSSNGHYSFYSYMVNTMVIPYMSMMAIANPIIAQSIKDNDLMGISKLYRQSSETLFILGLLIVLGGWLCLDPLLEITGKEDILGPLKSTFLILAIGQLINITTGLNEPIIGYSRYYRFNLYALVLLSAMNIGLNLYLIPTYGISGAAMATATSLGVYNVIKCVYIYYRFGILPFSAVHFKVLAIGIISFLAAAWLPRNLPALFQILLTGGVFVVVFGSILLYLRISEDVNRFAEDLLNRFKK